MASKAAARVRKSSGQGGAKAAASDRSNSKARAKAGRTGSQRVKAVTSRVPKSAVRPAAKPRALTKRELDEYRRLLEAERNRLTDELEAIEEHLPEVEQISLDASGGYDEDLADVASDTFEREKGIAIESSVQELLQQVEEALGRIEDGSYGACEMCGQAIHPDRLRALPYARLCINCKALEEQAIPR
jgi:RNA polymerase-binding protein DksA